MLHCIDHLVIAIRDLARASADFQRAGFTVSAGGEHASGDTRNALIPFAGGSYLELLAFTEPDRPQPHRWWPRLARGEGLVDFALGASDLAAEAAALRARGLDVEGPIDGGRTRPDGREVAWRILVVHDAVGTPLPFIIEDVTPRPLRVPGEAAAEHPLGAMGVEGVTVVVADLDRSVAAFGRLLGAGGVPLIPADAGVRAAHRFVVGHQWITLAEPDPPGSDIRAYLEQYGAGPYEVVLAGTHVGTGGGQQLPTTTTHGARIRIANRAEQDETYMRRCLELARRALAAGDVPVGALVVHAGRVIGEGLERTRARLDPAAHAEVEALRAACRTLGTLDLSGATLYTTVEPCVLCAYAARCARVGRVVFGVQAGALGGATGPYPLLTDAGPVAGTVPPAVRGGVLAGECERLLAERFNV